MFYSLLSVAYRLFSVPELLGWLNQYKLFFFTYLYFIRIHADLYARKTYNFLNNQQFKFIMKLVRPFGYYLNWFLQCDSQWSPRSSFNNAFIQIWFLELLWVPLIIHYLQVIFFNIIIIMPFKDCLVLYYVNTNFYYLNEIVFYNYELLSR